RDRDGNRAAQLRSRSSGALQGAAANSLRTRAAKNSDGQGPEVCPSRKAAGHFQTVTNSDPRLPTSDSEHWSLTSPGLVPATLAALPPIRASPARACSSFACQAVALAKDGASSFLRHSSVLYFAGTCL